MNKLLLTFIVMVLHSAFSLSTNAGEFEWLDNLNVQAKADSSGFRMRLATRFHIDDVEIRTVFNQVERKSDAYMMFRLGELSHRPINEIIHVYHENKDKGWGKMAKELGIKPGSKEFHSLKRGHDLDYGQTENKSTSSNKKKNKNKNKKKNKNN